MAKQMCFVWPTQRVFFLIEPIILKYDDFMFLSTSLAFLKKLEDLAILEPHDNTEQS